MAGTLKGGIKANQRIIERLGEEGAQEFRKRIGALGGKKSNNGGFASDQVGEDGLTGRERARIAGSIGGKKSRKPKRIKQ